MYTNMHFWFQLSRFGRDAQHKFLNCLKEETVFFFSFFLFFHSSLVALEVFIVCINFVNRLAQGDDERWLKRVVVVCWISV